jgi:hypothetical protein
MVHLPHFQKEMISPRRHRGRGEDKEGDFKEKREKKNMNLIFFFSLIPNPLCSSFSVPPR